MVLPIQQERRDYLEPARQLLLAAKREPVTILQPDEMLEGVLPFIASHHFPVCPDLEQLPAIGLCTWYDSRDQLRTKLELTNRVEIIYSADLSGGRKAIYLARLVPRQLPGKTHSP